jgi:hypothetical protein
MREHPGLEGATMHLDKNFVRHWSKRYVTEELGRSALEHELLSATHAAIARRGYLTSHELRQIVVWKSRRALGHLKWGDNPTVSDVTHVAFAEETPDWMRHHILDILPGVDHSVAGAILTVWDPRNHTMFDYKATEALEELRRRGEVDVEVSPGRYWAHVQTCREIANALGVGLRNLDRALWKWRSAGMP